MITNPFVCCTCEKQCKLTARLRDELPRSASRLCISFRFHLVFALKVIHDPIQIIFRGTVRAVRELRLAVKREGPMLDVQINKSQWKKPVCITFGEAGEQLVKGPHDALALMTEQWPFIRGAEFVRARSLCRAALDGRKTVEEARIQFEQAIGEARVSSN